MTQTATLAVNRIILGDAATTMTNLPDNSISCLITSPPYYGMRLYSGTEQTQALGGNPQCDHEWTAHDAGEFCYLCSAWRGALGHEPTVELYLEHLVEIFRVAKQKLRSDGVFYLNVGDCYCGSGSPGGDFRGGGRGDDYLRPYGRAGIGLKGKDLCLVPEKLVAALQMDGWYLRDRIAWVKRNARPESTEDRRTNIWEFVYMLTKTGHYYYDTFAVQERSSETSDLWRIARNVITANPTPLGYQLCKRCKQVYAKTDWDVLEAVEAPPRNYSGLRRPNHGDVGERAHKKHFTRRCACGATDWLTHTATFPKDLVKQLILAGCPAWVCSKCGKPRVRIVETIDKVNQQWGERRTNPWAFCDKREMPQKDILTPVKKTVGWTDCGCGAGFRPGIVLDMFFGSGTSGLVAENLGRDWLGIEVSEDYRRLADYRIRHECKRPPTPITELPTRLKEVTLR